MQTLQYSVRKRLSEKKLNKLSIWAFCIKMINTFFNWEFQINGYMRLWKLFIRPEPNYAKTQIFLKKKPLLDKINGELKNFWYNQIISDIIIK